MIAQRVNFPTRFERGEAGHAVADQSTSHVIGQGGAPTTTPPYKVSQSPRSDHSVVDARGGDAGLRHPRTAFDFTVHIGQLEATLDETPALRAGGRTTKRTTCGGRRQIYRTAHGCGSSRSPQAGVCLHAMDSPSACPIHGRADGRLGLSALDHRSPADARHRLAQDKADHPQSPKPSRNKTSPEGPAEAKKGALDPDADYELWFADGVRFDLLPVVVHTYRKRGQPLRIPTPGKNAKVAVCGGMRWPDGPFLFTHGPKSVNTSLFVGLLQMLEHRARRTGRRIVLVIDNGSAHTSKRSLSELKRVERCVRVFWLPTYTSEQLNDIENLWKHLKEDYFSRMLAKTREDFVVRAVQILSQLRRGGVLRQMLKPRHRMAVSKDLVRTA